MTLIFPALVTDRPETIEKVDLVLFCVKNYDFENSALQIKDLIADNTFVLPLQNAINKKSRLNKILGKGKILDGCAYVAAHIESPGIIRQNGSLRKIIFGGDADDTAALKIIEELMLKAGMDAVLADDVDLSIWTKYILICALSTGTSYYQKTVGEILNNAVDKAVLEGLIKEIEAVARKKGIKYPKDIFEVTMNTIKLFPYDTKTSMQRDIEQGKRSELEFFAGELVRLGVAFGVDTPLHRTAYESIKSKCAV